MKVGDWFAEGSLRVSRTEAQDKGETLRVDGKPQTQKSDRPIAKILIRFRENGEI